MTEDRHKNPRTKREEDLKIAGMIEKDQLEESSKTVDDIDEVSQDPTTPDYTEEKVTGEKIAKQVGGSTEIEHSGDMRKRFAIEHEEFVDKDSVLRKDLKMKVDKPADEEKAE